MTLQDSISSYSRGFDEGNYGNAYESQDWDSWYAAHCVIPEDVSDPDSYRNGLILGFFSSYELSEISDPDVADTVENLRSVYGEE